METATMPATQKDTAAYHFFPSDEVKLIRLTAILIRSINHKLRRQILDFIYHHENGETTVTELYKTLRLEQSVASQHLAILRREGIVKTRREGKCIYYSIDQSRVNKVMSFIKLVLKK